MVPDGWGSSDMYSKRLKGPGGNACGPGWNHYQGGAQTNPVSEICQLPVPLHRVGQLCDDKSACQRPLGQYQ